MKKIVVVIALALALISSCLKSPDTAHAGGGDVILGLILIGGAVYAGYYFSENYEITQKAAIEVKDGKLSLNRPAIRFETKTEKLRFAKKETYAMDLLKIKF